MNMLKKKRKRKNKGKESPNHRKGDVLLNCFLHFSKFSVFPNPLCQILLSVRLEGQSRPFPITILGYLNSTQSVLFKEKKVTTFSLREDSLQELLLSDYVY